jgi:methylase of polypeptide subunit release factors
VSCASESRPLLALLQRLEAAGYDFVTPTPETHGRVLRRPEAPGDDPLRRLLGWSLPVDPARLPPGVADLLAAAGALERSGDGVRSRLRVSRLEGLLFLHSAYPTTAPDAVFLGPDSYRFANFVQCELPADFAGRLVDLGGGCGVGALVAARRAPAAKVTLSDVNPQALRLARINAAHAGVDMEVVEADGLEGAPPALDLVIANPPYMANAAQTYSNGGALHGAGVSLAWTEAALQRLTPGGRLLLYTGSAIALGGGDRLKAALARICEARGARLTYRELDPDVFGEELDTDAYADIERIAAVGAVMTAAGGEGAA